MSKQYKEFKICKGCGKRFKSLHGLRLYCDYCKYGLDSTDKSQSKQWELKKKKLGVKQLQQVENNAVSMLSLASIVYTTSSRGKW